MHNTATRLHHTITQIVHFLLKTTYSQSVSYRQNTVDGITKNKQTTFLVECQDVHSWQHTISSLLYRMYKPDSKTVGTLYKL